MPRFVGTRVIESKTEYVVYQLVLPDDSRLGRHSGAVYVGQGNAARPFEHRVNVYSNYKNIPRYQVINGVWRIGLDYHTEIIHECETQLEARELERQTLQLYRADGLPLLNG